MTFDEAYRQVLSIFPNAQADEDNDGQLIIYTGTRETRTGELVLFDPDEDED